MKGHVNLQRCEAGVRTWEGDMLGTCQTKVLCVMCLGVENLSQDIRALLDNS